MTSMGSWEKLEAARGVVAGRCGELPGVALILGSGLGKLASGMKVESEIGYGEIPHLHRPGVAGHAGKIVVGSLGGVRVACLVGRLHFYEGHRMDEVVFPARLAAACGARAVVLTNAAGALNPSYQPADLCLLSDHLNLFGDSPLCGPNDERLGPRFVDLSRAYDADLRRAFRHAAAEAGIRLHEGVYVGIRGPCYETPAEVRMYRMFGGDVVGMSTVPEVIALRHAGVAVAALSCVTNVAAGHGEGQGVSHDDVLATAELAYASFHRLVEAALPEISRVAQTGRRR